MFQQTNLIRYLSQEEAYALSAKGNNNGTFAVEGSAYNVYSIDYTIAAKTESTHTNSYLSTSMGSGSQIVGFLDADAIVFGLENGVGSDWGGLQTNVTGNRTSFLFACDIRHGNDCRLGYHPYVDGCPDEDRIIHPPANGMVKMKLGGFLEGGGNPYEVNFMSSHDVIVPSVLLLHDKPDPEEDTNRGIPLARLDKFMKTYDEWRYGLYRR
jgi:hypothetical protein